MNNSNHSSDQLGAAANRASQFDRVSQQQIQHRNMATSSTPKTGKTLDPKTIRRLAQNREAARKSRLRKKVSTSYLETEIFQQWLSQVLDS
jgi:transcription factor TGA